MLENKIKGLVLAGGKSSRLGMDKAIVQFRGQNLLQRSFDLLKGLVDEVWVAGRCPGQWNGPCLEDQVPGLGPIGGILTAFGHLQGPLLVISCDLPLLRTKTLERLLRARTTRHPGQVMTTYRQTETGFIESLVAVYEPEARGLLEAARRRGEYKLSQAIPTENRLHIPYSQEEALPFFNVNYPADLALLRVYERYGEKDLQGKLVERQDLQTG